MNTLKNFENNNLAYFFSEGISASLEHNIDLVNFSETREIIVDQETDDEYLFGTNYELNYIVFSLDYVYHSFLIMVNLHQNFVPSLIGLLTQMGIASILGNLTKVRIQKLPRATIRGKFFSPEVSDIYQDAIKKYVSSLNDTIALIRSTYSYRYIFGGYLYFDQVRSYYDALDEMLILEKMISDYIHFFCSLFTITQANKIVTIQQCNKFDIFGIQLAKLHYQTTYLPYAFYGYNTHDELTVFSNLIGFSALKTDSGVNKKYMEIIYNSTINLYTDDTNLTIYKDQLNPTLDTLIIPSLLVLQPQRFESEIYKYVKKYNPSNIKIFNSLTDAQKFINDKKIDSKNIYYDEIKFTQDFENNHPILYNIFQNLESNSNRKDKKNVIFLTYENILPIHEKYVDYFYKNFSDYTMNYSKKYVVFIGKEAIIKYYQLLSYFIFTPYVFTLAYSNYKSKNYPIFPFEPLKNKEKFFEFVNFIYTLNAPKVRKYFPDYNEFMFR